LFNPQLLKQRISGSFEVKLLKHRLELVSRLSSTFSDFVAAQRDMQKQILFNSDSEAIYVEIGEDKLLQVFHN
jgi:signal transduction histidine kinase